MGLATRWGMGGYEIPKVRNLMQGLHALESGQVTGEEIKKLGLAHALIGGRHARTGKTAEQRIKEWQKYVEKVEGVENNSLTRAKTSWKKHAEKEKLEEGAATSQLILLIVSEMTIEA